ncbi:polysaccharide biosynthesis C-terminal domain-containing protein [Parapedobacter sp. ISTM3]|uniref:lipopolysaccharide biosynthesis protein n=1 Tax=Parapedobacter sp. ISTM3 TaxID=2800130 RepID=UPI00190400A5|nr:polysaccharide biosynthesis C-terminal domain-containing protein [Parapedobacter sp. ISTM3]MBK1442225.1 polysaccharide biosynthesis C-terminal domain-containing protein [Parapedobacter sp. ISTM3]
MSAFSRLVSGTTAAWLKIIITLISQLAIVPLYLSFWDIETYGVWLAVWAFQALLTMLDIGHQNYLGYKFLKLGLQPQREQLGLHLCSGMIIGFFLGAFQLVVVVFICLSNRLGQLLSTAIDLDDQLLRDAGIVLMLQSATWMLTGSAGGICGRALYAFDYYPRMAWWGVLMAFANALIPAIGVVLGAGLLQTGINLVLSTWLVNFFLYVDMFSLFKKEGIPFNRWNLRLGFQNWVNSLALSWKSLLENWQVGGVRLMVSSLAGTQALVTFTTIRTGANFAMQGLHSITDPLMPELMRFLHQRDQARSEIAFSTVWMILVGVMAPMVVLLQAFITPLYAIWTRRKLDFDPALFAYLSIGVLVYALAQPAIAIVLGNNLLRQQLIINTGAALILVIGVFLLVPWIGIKGAGLALLISELIMTAAYFKVAIKWLETNQLMWPKRIATLALLAVIIAGTISLAMVYWPGSRWVLVTIGLVALVANTVSFWKELPLLARDRAKTLMNKIPLICNFRAF